MRIVNAFVIWIAVQLAIWGAVAVDVSNEVFEQKYDCTPVNRTFPIWLGVVFPVTLAIPAPDREIQRVDAFCTEHRVEK